MLSLSCLTKPQFSEPQRMVASSWLGLASFDGFPVWTAVRVKTVYFSLIVCVSAQDSSQGKIGFILWEFDISPWVFGGLMQNKNRSPPPPTGACMNPLDNCSCGPSVRVACLHLHIAVLSNFCILEGSSTLSQTAKSALFPKSPWCSLYNLRDEIFHLCLVRGTNALWTWLHFEGQRVLYMMKFPNFSCLQGGLIFFFNRAFLFWV